MRSPLRFPSTRQSLVAESTSRRYQSRSFGMLVSIYWHPINAHIRRRWNVAEEDAGDLTQEFFTTVLEKSYLDSYDPARGRFRTFLRVCLDRFVANQLAAAGREKRGGGIDFIPIEGDGEIVSPEGIDEEFEREWIRSLFEIALERLREECASTGRDKQYAVFRAYDLSDDDRPSYAELARRFELPATQVTNYLAYARRELRRIVLDHLREITASEEEFRSEARAVLGVDPR